MKKLLLAGVAALSALYASNVAAWANPWTEADGKDVVFIALKTVDCGTAKFVVWIPFNTATQKHLDFYRLTPLSNAPSPITGKFNITDKQEIFLDGKKCEAWSSSKHAESARMIEDRFGLPVFQVGPDDRVLWLLARILLKDKSIGEMVLPDRKERCSGIFPPNSPAIEHGWCAANVLPYCIDDDNFGDEFVKMTPPKGFTCRPWDQIRKRLMNR